MSHIKSKDIVLGKIKSALSNTTSYPVSIPEQDTNVFKPFAENDLIFEFANRFKSINGQFVFCIDEQEFIDQLAQLFIAKRIKNAFAWDSKLKSILQNLKLPITFDDEDFINCDLGITTCEFLVARTGGIGITSNTESGRRLSVYPPIHVVLAYSSQIVPEIKNGIQKSKEKYQGLQPSLTSIISGPSRTADIEKTLVLGAHGPKELILFLIDDTIL